MLSEKVGLRQLGKKSGLKKSRTRGFFCIILLFLSIKSVLFFYEKKIKKKEEKVNIPILTVVICVKSQMLALLPVSYSSNYNLTFQNRAKKKQKKQKGQGSKIRPFSGTTALYFELWNLSKQRFLTLGVHQVRDRPFVSLPRNSSIN